jgi:membrane protein DedA with SNARE-associated domain
VSGAQPQLPGIFHTLEPWLDHWGYLAVAAFVFLEDFGVPVPGETILIAASVFAGAGRLNIVVVAVVAFAAAVLGDNIGYAIGRFGGSRAVARWGRYVGLTLARVEKATMFFGRHGGKIIVVARFVEGLRQANGIVAGISRLSFFRFVSFNALGAALWVTLWCCVGYFAGNHIVTIYDDFSRYSLYLLAAGGVAAGALVVRVMLRRRARAAAATVSPNAEAPEES